MFNEFIDARRSFIAAAVSVLLSLSACGGGGDDSSTSSTSWSTPSAPAGVGTTATASTASSYASSLQPFVSNYKTNVTANTTASTNAAYVLLGNMSNLWTTGSTWSNGTANTATTSAAATVLDYNINKVATMMTAATSTQNTRAWLDAIQNANYSTLDALGPLASYYITGSGAATAYTSVPSAATTDAYSQEASSTGGSSSSSLGYVYDLVNTLRGNYASGNPSKTFFQYPRPWRQTGTLSSGTAAVIDTGSTESITDTSGTTRTWPVYTSPVTVLATLKPERGTTASSDGGFPSGHTNAGYLASIAMAYALPERFQELLTRAAEIGDSRIRSGFHSPLDVMGGRMLATALAAATLADSGNATLKANARAQALAYMVAQTGATADTLNTFAHTSDSTRFASATTNKANYLASMTYGFSQIGTTGVAAVVPDSAEVLLETRFPYLTAAQRRVVLKSTAIDSGYPLLDDTEGWGRLNLVAAADGYGAFDGDVTVTMNTADGGFATADTWGNNISGTGLLTKAGTGALTLSGTNTFSGGLVLTEGTLVGTSATAFGTGDVYQSGGTLKVTSHLTMGARYTQTSGTLSLVLGASGQGRVVVTSDATVGGNLVVSFSGYTPSVGDEITVLTASALHGTFGSITVSGYTVTPTYGTSSIKLRITAVSSS
jgi:autotransporter-associated beta strand protein